MQRGVYLHQQRDAEAVVAAAAIGGAAGVLLDLFQPSNAIATWSRARIHGVRAQLSASGLAPVVHGDFTQPIGHVDRAQRARAVAAVRRELELAAALDAAFVLHPTACGIGADA